MLHREGDTNFSDRRSLELFQMSYSNSWRRWRNPGNRPQSIPRKNDRSMGYIHLCRLGNMPSGMGRRKVLAVLCERRKGRYRNQEQQHHDGSNPDAGGGIRVHDLTAA